jgi:hypothetical protein
LTSPAWSRFHSQTQQPFSTSPTALTRCLQNHERCEMVEGVISPQRFLPYSFLPQTISKSVYDSKHCLFHLYTRTRSLQHVPKTKFICFSIFYCFIACCFPLEIIQNCHACLFVFLGWYVVGCSYWRSQNYQEDTTLEWLSLLSTWWDMSKVVGSTFL